MKRAGSPALIALAALVACDRAAPAPMASGALPAGVVARVGVIDVTADHVGRVAAVQRVPVEEARQLAVSDALLARAALDRGLDRSPAVSREIDAELARRLARRMLADARATPPTEAELAEAAARKWLDVDRPEGFRTVHAVVRHDAQQDEAHGKRARAVAEAIHAAAERVAARAGTMPMPEGGPLPQARQRPEEDPDPLSSAFRVAAAAVPRDGMDIVIEPLLAVAADGRVLAAGGQRFDGEFAAAAAKLPSRGALSPVSQTPFGYHVILLLERTPAIALEGAARRQRLFDDIVNERARAAEKRLLAALKPKDAITADAPGLLDLVVVDP
jgi:peptidyl-prolyl cis-trans isomerase C